MKNVTKEFLKYAMLPIIILLILVLLGITFKLLGLPSFAEIKLYAEEIFVDHGYMLVFVGALAEGVLMLNWYLPGSVVIVMGTVFAAEAGYNVVAIVGLIILGFFITTLINYALGKYGWYKLLLKFGMGETLEKAKLRLEKHGPKIILGTYFHPNIGAFTATSAGVLKIPFQQFLMYSVISLIIWNIFWGMLVVFIGPDIIKLLTYQVLMLILGLWILGMLGFFIWKKRRTA